MFDLPESLVYDMIPLAVRGEQRIGEIILGNCINRTILLPKQLETYFWYLILICGCEDGELTQFGPSGAYFAWNAFALGTNYINGKTFLERRKNLLFVRSSIRSNI
uniref:Uncharacterized protein n=1 Tax=Rhodnius prolixus TaxID=13249 RepID=T1HWU5_RHOPR